jgi:hypothetical protein
MGWCGRLHHDLEVCGGGLPIGVVAPAGQNPGPNNRPQPGPLHGKRDGPLQTGPSRDPGGYCSVPNLHRRTTRSSAKPIPHFLSLFRRKKPQMPRTSLFGCCSRRSSLSSLREVDDPLPRLPATAAGARHLRLRPPCQPLLLSATSFIRSRYCDAASSRPSAASFRAPRA